jgi:hypothetical protein
VLSWRKGPTNWFNDNTPKPLFCDHLKNPVDQLQARDVIVRALGQINRSANNEPLLTHSIRQNTGTTTDLN